MTESRPAEIVGHAWIVNGPASWRSRIAIAMESWGYSTTVFECVEGCAPMAYPAQVSVILMGAVGAEECAQSPLPALTHTGIPVIVFVAPLDMKTARAVFRLGAFDVCELLVSETALHERIQAVARSARAHRKHHELVLGGL